MPEGLLVGGAVAGAVHDDKDHEPEPSADAPRGWTWDRKGRKWQPRQRGPVLFGEDVSRPGHGAQGEPATAPSSAHETAGPGYQADPDPAWLRDGDGQQQDSISGEKLKWDEIPAEAKDNAASLAGMLGMPLLAFAQAVDPFCGAALAGNYENIIDHCLPLVLRSKKAVAFFTSKDSDWLLWFGLAQALWPVATAVFQHHITRTVEVVRDEQGQAHAVRRSRGEPEHGDHLTPPAAPYDYAA